MVSIGYKLTCGRVMSCGCLAADKTRERSTTHGMTGTATYRTWNSMMMRCASKNNKDYGGRGIRVSESWMRFEGFYADMGARPDGTTLERIDNYGNYSKENCVWATRTEQQRNTRFNRLITINGHTKCVSEWAEIYGLNTYTCFSRLARGWDEEKAVTTPARCYGNQNSV